MEAQPRQQASAYLQPPAWYERIYAAGGKDWSAEAAIVERLVRQQSPAARTLLDVGCGTGLHLAHLNERFDEVAGVDLDPAFVACARTRGLDVSIGDIERLDLGRVFDVVTCLYGVVAHLPDTDSLRRAARSLAAHLAPGGLLVLEPWVDPSAWDDGAHGATVSEEPDSILVRVDRGSTEGDTAVLDCAFTHVDASGITRLDEQLRLTLFTRSEYGDALEAAGLAPTFLPDGLDGDARGLWIARHG